MDYEKCLGRWKWLKYWEMEDYLKDADQRQKELLVRKEEIKSLLHKSQKEKIQDQDKSL